MEDSAKLGRPEKPLDWNLLDRTCSVPLRQEDIACIVGLSQDTIARRIKEHTGLTFAEYIEQKRAPFREKLLNKQIDVAMGGNVALLIWLGKQYLGQKDQTETTVAGGIPIQLNYNLEKPQTGR